MLGCDSVPPTPSPNNLSDRRIVISLAHIESEEICGDLRFGICILVIEDFVEFTEKLLIDSVEEVRSTNGFGIEWCHTVTSGHWDLEILEEFD